MSEPRSLPPHLYAVIRFMGATAGIFPSLDAAKAYRDANCKGGDVYAIRITDEHHYITGAKLA